MQRGAGGSLNPTVWDASFFFLARTRELFPGFAGTISHGHARLPTASLPPHCLSGLFLICSAWHLPTRSSLPFTWAETFHLVPPSLSIQDMSAVG